MFYFIFLINAFAEIQKTISVKNAEEFAKAIGNNITIRLNTERLDISNIAKIHHSFIKIIEMPDGIMLQIENVKNLRIVGQKNFTKIINNSRYSYILAFKNTENITLENLEAGHSAFKGTCQGGVFLFEESKKIQLKDCILFGSGTEGLTIKKVKEAIFRNIVIKSCTKNILTIQNSENIRFLKSRFTDNQDLDLFSIANSENILFEECLIDLNKTGRGESYDNYALFHVPQQPGIYETIVILRKCKIEDNYTQFFCRSKDVIKIEDCKIENNIFERGYNSFD